MMSDAVMLNRVKHACSWASSMPSASARRIFRMQHTDLSQRSERVAYAIKASGLNAATAAKRIGVSRSTVSQWCSGSTKDIKNDYLFALEDVTGFSARWIATGQGPQRSVRGQVARLLEEAPPEIVQETLDFMGYKITTCSALLSSENTARYLKWIDSIGKDLQNRKLSDSQ